MKKKLKKTYLKKADTAWSQAIRKLYPVCIICGKDKNLNAHHLITKKIMKLRYNLKNGVTLCSGCHSLKLKSAHVSPYWFIDELYKLKHPAYYWLQVHKYDVNDETVIYSIDDLLKIEKTLT